MALIDRLNKQTGEFRSENKNWKFYSFDLIVITTKTTALAKALTAVHTVKIFATLTRIFHYNNTPHARGNWTTNNPKCIITCMTPTRNWII
jgi:hypothetical protein